jgi:methionyl aminopeptidase
MLIFCDSDSDRSTRVSVKSAQDIKHMRASCRLAADVLQYIGSQVSVGATTEDLDRMAHAMIVSNNAYPSPLLYHGFPKSICTSVNNVACHGIPDTRVLEDGDIVNIDISVYLANGFHGDCSDTFLVGDVDAAGRKLVKVTQSCLQRYHVMCL